MSDKKNSNVDIQTDSKEKTTGGENHIVYTKSISIKSVLKGATRDIPLADEEIDENDQVTKIQNNLHEEDITEIIIQKTWEDYAEKIAGKYPRQYNTLKQNKPRLNSDGIILVELSTDAQRDNFNLHIKPGLVNYFRQHIKNIDYQFETKVVQKSASSNKLYTDQDKLEYLISKNKDLEQFKNRFNLDIDQ